MAEKRIEWTEQQRRAIDARSAGVLVTASAGTGKTAVLSGRCVRIVSDKSICPDVWSILVLTFTEAAAEQMRSRIADRLKAAFLDTRDPHLRRQLMLLQGADISTIHSFCKRLITEYFYKLDLDPTFSVIDGDEQRLLKSEVLEKTIDWAWQQAAIQPALEQLLSRRDLRTNDGFLARVVELNDFLDGVISRQSWYEKATWLAEVVDPFTTDLGAKQKQLVAKRLQHILAQIQYAMKLYETNNAGGNWATKWRETFAQPVAQYIELIESGCWDEFSQRIRASEGPSRFEYKPRGLSGPAAETIRSLAESAKKSFDRLFDLAILNPAYADRLGDSVRLQTRVLVELVRRFDQLYTQAKRAINCLDFADLEHYALRLLTDEHSGQDGPSPSETALALRQRYKHIFVDEYQDVNSVQQGILRLLSPGASTLGVGDVKQSIYAFRGAEPDIFLEQLRRASTDPKDASKGLRVDLNANFRSARGILDFVNAIFSRIMTASFARLDYDEAAQLKPGFAGESGYQGQGAKENSAWGPLAGVVEFHILDQLNDADDVPGEDEGESPEAETLNLVTSRQRQAAMIARRIRQMVGADTGRPEFQIYDRGQDVVRDVQYRDIVVLMRSLSKKANDYVEVFRLAGVPVSSQATAGYFEATEISDVLCLLKVLDNPQRDIELAAVLRSPLFEVSDTELARIRLHEQMVPSPKSYYDRVLGYSCSATDALAEKLQAILARIEHWRSAARRGNIADLIWRVYRQTRLLPFVSALPNGQARRANLLKLHDRAIQFEGFASSVGIPSLTRFVEFIEKLQAAGQDWAPAEPQASAGNAVRILSVHKSKGLEFPVVFLAELDSRFNMKDVQADCLADVNDTLGLQVIDRRSNSKISSLAHEVIAEQKLSTALAEEMRILYVATTRARDRLILTASQGRKKCRQIIEKGMFLGAEPVPDWLLRACRSPLEWILYALSKQKILHDIFGTSLAERAISDDLFRFELHSQSDLKRLCEFVIALKSGRSRRRGFTAEHAESAEKKYNQGSSAFSAVSAAKRSLSWRYRFGETSCLPAKSSVTQLTHANDEFVKFDYSGALDRQPNAVMTVEPDLDKPVEARLIGTATHLVISQLDLTEPVTIEAIERTKERLIAANAMPAAAAGHIDRESILAFFQTELGALSRDASNSVWREWPFTFALPASEWIGDCRLPICNRKSQIASRKSHKDTIVVQGIIDLLVRTPRGLVIVDFKTDRVSAEQVNERAELYRRQLQLYARAASAILQSEAIARWLHFLAPRCSVEVQPQ